MNYLMSNTTVQTRTTPFQSSFKHHHNYTTTIAQDNLYALVLNKPSSWNGCDMNGSSSQRGNQSFNGQVPRETSFRSGGDDNEALLMAALLQQEEEEEKLGTWGLPDQENQPSHRVLLAKPETGTADTQGEDDLSPLCQAKGCTASRTEHQNQLPVAAALLEDSETMSLFVAADATTRKRRREDEFDSSSGRNTVARAQAHQDVAQMMSGSLLAMPPPPHPLRGAMGQLKSPPPAVMDSNVSGYDFDAYDENSSSSSASLSAVDSLDGEGGGKRGRADSGVSSSGEKPTKRRSSSSRVQQQQEDKWNKHFQQLCEFQKTYGHANVPHNYNDNPVLARWVKRQRHQYRLQKEGRLPSPDGGSSALAPLPDSRIKALEQIGFVWDVYGDVWKERVAELLEYKRKTGSTDVPCRFQENPQLAIWVSARWKVVDV